jgi:hypothetical protein
LPDPVTFSLGQFCFRLSRFIKVQLGGRKLLVSIYPPSADLSLSPLRGVCSQLSNFLKSEQPHLWTALHLQLFRPAALNLISEPCAKVLCDKKKFLKCLL